MNQAPEPAKILVVDDDDALARFIVEVLTDAGHHALAVASGAEALLRIEANPPDLVITDLRMPDMSGLELIAAMRAYDPRIVVLAITAFGSIETAVRSIRTGAADYVTKPFEPDELLLAVDKCLRERRMQVELVRLRNEVERREGFGAVIARSAVMQQVLNLALRVADSPSTLLITGPSGAGKEVLARAVHQSSRRRSEAFVAINCAAIPDSLLESELFGYKKGAFTGAGSDKRGLLREAHQGTLFLDEIGDLPFPLQVKLLRVLQEREVRAVGAIRAEPIDVRLIAATNRDLRKRIAEGSFREDLYYRLSVIEIAIPRLCDRPDDIVPLAEHFLSTASSRVGRQIAQFSGAAKRLLCSYSWPGNVRELENATERAVNLCDGDTVTPDDLPAALRRPREEDFLDRAVEQQWSMADLQIAYARRVLAQMAGNKKQAASKLGIDRRTLQRWFGERDTDDAGDVVSEIVDE